VGGALMARALHLFLMALVVQLEGTVFAPGSLRNLEIQQHIREALEEPDMAFQVEVQVDGHPVMRPDTGFINLVSTSRPHTLFFLILILDFVGRRL
jgi:hypothetical protein